jgi:hypothetical protein
MGMTMLWILNDGENLSFDDETKSESLTENLMQKTEGGWDEAERCKDDPVDSVICACGSSILLRLFYANAKGL